MITAHWQYLHIGLRLIQLLGFHSVHDSIQQFGIPLEILSDVNPAGKPECHTHYGIV